MFFTPKVIYARHQINWHLQFTSWEIFLYLVEMECVGGSWDWDMANWQREINSVPGKLVSNHEDLLFFLNLSNLGGELTLVFFKWNCRSLDYQERRHCNHYTEENKVQREQKWKRISWEIFYEKFCWFWELEQLHFVVSLLRKATIFGLCKNLETVH